jgi:3-oxoacyl-[acyl-carrier-protein] synthase-1
MNIYISSMSMLSCLGSDPLETLRRIIAKDISGVSSNFSFGKNFLLGAIEPSSQKTHNYNLALQTLLSRCYEKIRNHIEDLKKRFGEHRIGVVLGSSNCGIEETYTSLKAALNSDGGRISPETLEIGTPSEFLAELSGVCGPAYTISTACSSGAKAFMSGRNLIKSGLADAVIVGGVDNLCSFAVNGFDALEALSNDHSIPFDKDRNGINIGEACALFILSPVNLDGEGIRLLGIGESSDAFHITSPDPTGEYAAAAMKSALKNANLTPSQIDYINLHGTGTIANDVMESAAVNLVFGSDVYCSSTKPLTGHTLGAGGALEIAVCWLLLSSFNKERELPPHHWNHKADEAMKPVKLVNKATKADKLSCCLSSSFAFGGSNTCVVVGR